MKSVIFALSAMVLKASWGAALTTDEVDITPEMLEAEDACADGDERCHVQLLQLKAEKKEQTLKNSAEPLPADTESEAEDDEAEDQDEPPADDGQDVPENELGLAQAVKDYPSRYNPWQDGNVPIWDKLGLAQDQKAQGNAGSRQAIKDYPSRYNPWQDGNVPIWDKLGLAQDVKDYPSRYNPWQDGNVPIWDKLGLAQDEKAQGNSGSRQAIKDYPSRYNPWQDGNVPIWDKLGLAQDEKAPGNSRGPPAIEDEDQQHSNVAFFEELDSNKDAEIQRSEVDAMLAHRIDLDESDVDRLFQDADKDQSGGLSMVEYEDALEKWSTSCATVHRSWFCSGRTRINCCRHGAVWARCAGGGQAHGCGVRSFR